MWNDWTGDLVDELSSNPINGNDQVTVAMSRVDDFIEACLSEADVLV